MIQFPDSQEESGGAFTLSFNMEPTTLVHLTTLLLLTVESVQTNIILPIGGNDTHNAPPAVAPQSSTASPALSPTAAITLQARTGAPQLAFILLQWTNPCAAEVNLHSVNSSSLTCHTHLDEVQRLLGDVCESKKDCKGVPVFTANSGSRPTGVICAVLRVNCTVEVADVVDEGQLKAYKVTTALLCCVLLLVLLMWRCRPSVRALQKRLSNRRKSRWIGPKQMSYHRGENGEKKKSQYPVLEQLAVRDSSPNRYVDYDL